MNNSGYICVLFLCIIFSKASFSSYIVDCEVLPPNPVETDTVEIVTTIFFSTNFVDYESEVQIDGNEILIHLNTYQGWSDIVEVVPFLELIGTLDPARYSYSIVVDFYEGSHDDYEQFDSDTVHGDFNIREAVGVGDELEVYIPDQFSIVGIHPNPFNSNTGITYTLSAAAQVHLEVYDVSGRLVVELVNEQQQSGTHKAVWGRRNG